MPTQWRRMALQTHFIGFCHKRYFLENEPPILGLHKKPRSHNRCAVKYSSKIMIIVRSTEVSKIEIPLQHLKVFVFQVALYSPIKWLALAVLGSTKLSDTKR
ncbi:uncharacterized protein LOC106089979 [Stomoxys calcitrans]|uniref:Uncharacterized protein n=1 Tax=Stomoxys calcitrans TaxID=35570 RepID=A0A1I8P1T8_STOCA|nr:uncharacterized protein LOC106089979 [Stomoxys calcitrans]